MKAKVLVVDDQIGRPGPHQRAFRAACADVDSEPTFGLEAELLFHSGQDEKGRNSSEGLAQLDQTISKAWDEAREEPLALVLLDVRFDEDPIGRADALYGFTILAHLRARFGSDLPIVMLSSEGETKRAQANRADADGYLPKEMVSRGTICEHLATCGLVEDWRPKGQRLVGRDRQFLKAIRVARQYADSPAEGLVLYGETGTGKTEFARLIHDSSGRADAPFLTWKVRRTNEELVKDELFGHWADAFNNANSSIAGLVERAHGGTVFFDEIGDLTPSILQLLLETRRRDAQGLRTLHRLGHFPSDGPKSKAVMEAERSVRGHLQRDHSIKVDAAFLAATNQNLADPEVRDRLEIRADYFEELGLPLTIPSLNERRSDIPLIVAAVLEKSQFRGMKVGGEAMEMLSNEDWTDRNIVALEKVVLGAARKAKDFGEILPRHLAHRGEREGTRVPSAKRSESLSPPSASLRSIGHAPASASAEALDSPGALAEEKMRYLRARVDTLAYALAATCVWDAELPKYSVTRAVQRMLGRRMETTEALRLVREILDDVLEPVSYEREALRQYGLEKLQARIQEDSVLQQIGRYARRQATMDAVNTELQRLHRLGDDAPRGR
jgi:DNA-binding NtrC family response regulator